RSAQLQQATARSRTADIIGGNSDAIEIGRASSKQAATAIRYGRTISGIGGNGGVVESYRCAPRDKNAAASLSLVAGDGSIADSGSVSTGQENATPTRAGTI